jgi:transposase
MLKDPNCNKNNTIDAHCHHISAINEANSSLNLSSFYLPSDMVVESAVICNNKIELYIKSVLDYGICPYCGHISEKIHSQYQRVITDLPVLGKRVVIHFRPRKFFCQNDFCSKKTFAEQPGNEVFRYRRRTRRCEQVVTHHGLMSSSNDASSLLNGMGIPLCNTTVLRDIHRIRIPENKEITNIGIDDWAFRKGINYGSIIVNLGTGHVIDLLGDRERDSFSKWLECHQQVSLVSRDRSTEYSTAIALSGKRIIEVADRFHLIKNMSDCVTKTISENYSDYRNAVRSGNEITPEEKCIQPDIQEICNDKLSGDKKQEVNNNTDSRTIMFNEVKELQDKGFSIGAIAKKLKIARQTVRKYRNYTSLPPRKSSPRNEYFKFDSYVESEYSNGKSLVNIFHEIKNLGFKGSKTPFHDHYRYLSKGRKGRRTDRPKSIKKIKPQDNREPLIPVKTISSIVDKGIRMKELDEKEDILIQTLISIPWFKEIYNAATSFYKIFKEPNGGQLAEWINEYRDTELAKLKTFITGIILDMKAVENGIKYPFSNGIVEGFVNKLKTIKRMMYGKAKLMLLKRKLVLGTLLFN